MKNKPEIVLKNRKVLLNDIVDTTDNKCVLDEVMALIKEAYPKVDLKRVEAAHSDVIKLFTGDYPGYRECSTAYHDLRHTLEVFLAMARIIHGAYTEGKVFHDNDVVLGLFSALLHDAGYIQTEDDRTGTGGKYTMTHVKRSVDFMIKYCVDKNYPIKDALRAAHLIESTSITVDFEKIPYDSPDMREIGKMIFAADLMGQMADRTYLEKLHLLYLEFTEGDVVEFKDEEALLRKTVDFVEEIRKRISNEFDSFSKYMRGHFKHRCNISRDFYSEAVQTNLSHLKKILSADETDYQLELKRMGILERISNLKS
jgi:hypothetical protein